MNSNDCTTRTSYGATQAEWEHFASALGLTADLLPVVSDTTAKISPNSKMKAIGKTPSMFSQEGFVVGISRWTERISDSSHIERWSKDPRYGICVQTRCVRAIDIDIPDPEKSAEVRRFVEAELGMALPCRMRPNSGKLLLTVRVSAVGKLSKAIVKTADGPVEFLCDGQQFVACGTHPSGVRYEWEGGLPADIPEITEAQFLALQQALAARFGVAGGVSTSKPSAELARARNMVDVNDDAVAWLSEHGWALGSKDGAVYVRCPNEAEHSSDNGITQAVYFPAGLGGLAAPGFKCLHAHCAHIHGNMFLELVGFKQPLEFDDCSDASAQADAAIKRARMSATSLTRLIQNCELLGESPAETCETILSEIARSPLTATEEAALITALKKATGTPVSALRSDLRRARSAAPPHAATVSPKAPVQAARALVGQRYTRDGVIAIRRWQQQFYAYDGRCYAEMSDEDVRAQVYRLFADAGVQLENKAPVDNTVDALKAQVNVSGATDMPSWVGDDQPAPVGELTAVGNGLLQMSTRQLFDHTPKLFTTSATDVIYNPAAPAPANWLRFLAEAFPGDPEAIECLQQWFGYLLTPDTSQQKALIAVGRKRSGKGTAARVLQKLVGMKDYCGPTLKGLGTQFGLQPLIAARVAVISDARVGSQADLQTVAENLLRITGEDIVSVDRKHIGAWTGKLSTRFILLTNVMPAIVDPGGALASRFIVLHFGQSFFGREDTALGSKLDAELSGILNWALDGLDSLRRRGAFIQPASGQAAMVELQRRTTPILGFMQDALVPSPTSWVSKDTLFDLYKAWCDSSGLRYTASKDSFMSELYAVADGLASDCRLRSGAGRVRAVRGFKVSEEYAAPHMFDPAVQGEVES